MVLDEIYDSLYKISLRFLVKTFKIEHNLMVIESLSIYKMKWMLISIILLISLQAYGQVSKKIDSLEYELITPDEFCEIFNDSVLSELTASFFSDPENLPYETLLKIALAWNSPKLNQEILKLKEIDLCAMKFSPAKRVIWGDFMLSIDDYWSNDILFFSNGMLALHQEAKQPIFPYYKLISDKPSVSYFAPTLIDCLRKDDGIQIDSLREICKKDITINEFFVDLNPPLISHLTLMEKDEKIAYISDGNKLSSEQKLRLRKLEKNQYLEILMTIEYPNAANFLVTETIGSLIYKIVK
ncbi:MAG: hypothetical protein AB8G15_10655 [Saprospiraceae bacterium]